MTLNEMGYPVELLPYAEWRQQMLAAPTSSFGPLAYGLPTWHRPHPVFDCSTTWAAAREAGVEFPAADATMMRRHIMFLAESGVPVCGSRHATRRVRCTSIGADPRGVTILADALVSFGYLTGSATGYGLTPLSDKWLVDSPYATVELFWQRVMFELWDGIEESVRTGKPAVDFMLDSHAQSLADELAPLRPVPSGPARLLDIGGRHGRYSTALCARHPTLTATVLDFPSALGPGGPRVTMSPRNYLEMELGLRVRPGAAVQRAARAPGGRQPGAAGSCVRSVSISSTGRTVRCTASTRSPGGSPVSSRCG